MAGTSEHIICYYGAPVLKGAQGTGSSPLFRICCRGIGSRSIVSLLDHSLLLALTFPV